MNARANFLNGLFQLLEAQGIEYCVLRNYGDLYAESETADIDLMVRRKDVSRFDELLKTAATETGLRLAHRTRYVNHSRTFWAAPRQFTRIDFDTESRWRLCPVLSAGTILKAAQKYENFHVPSPQHESVVLFAQAIWQGKLSPRYRDRLAQLYARCADKAELRQTYRKAFGRAGEDLIEFQEGVSGQEFDRTLCSRLKRSLILKTILHAAAWPDFIWNVVTDLQRLWQRFWRPTGISLLCVSSTRDGNNPDAMANGIRFLFSSQGCFQHTFDLSAGADPAHSRNSKFGFQRLRALFKGGLFVLSYRLASDADIPNILRRRRRLYASREFIYTEDSQHRRQLIHAGSGCAAIADGDGTEERKDPVAWLLGFLCAVLEQKKQKTV
jgi:hypothetical protein